MDSEKPEPQNRRRVVTANIIGVFIVFAAAGAIFYCTFSLNPFAKSITLDQISEGTISVTGEGNILIAYFSLTNNREYSSGGVDAASSVS